MFLECLEPLVFAGVVANYTSITHSSTITYTCETGYDIDVGNTTSVCEDGYWSGIPLSCVIKGSMWVK